MNQHHSSQTRWFTEFTCLDYDEEKDHVTCFLFSNDTRINWILRKTKKKLSEKPAFVIGKKHLYFFKKHQKSQCHLAVLTYEVTVPLCGNIHELTDQAVKSNMTKNRRCLITVLETLQFLGRQGLALRGDASEDESNFIQLLKLRNKDFPELVEWMRKKTDKYISHVIQNEICDISEKIRDSFYAIICDEYNDMSNKERSVNLLLKMGRCVYR